jgi:cyclopropane fatty-acyl-phospholipid synthase-like methyltransferase
MEPGTRDVKEFYDSFLSGRMVNYRLYGNERIEAAIDFIGGYIKPHHVVVDIGCGIGIATEAAAKKAANGRVIGADISAENIRYASQTVKLPNISFHCLDVIGERAKLMELLNGQKVDVFIMIDVIEHLPDATRHEIFKTMSELGSAGCAILLTYPSPHYQRYLIANEPQELQVIDNVLPVEQLAREAGENGFELVSYALKDIWRPAQYAHCALKRAAALAGAAATLVEANPLATLRRRVANKIMAPIRRRKYVTGAMSGK